MHNDNILNEQARCLFCILQVLFTDDMRIISLSLHQLVLFFCGSNQNSDKQTDCVFIPSVMLKYGIFDKENPESPSSMMMLNVYFMRKKSYQQINRNRI